jgi:hypothetical protein
VEIHLKQIKILKNTFGKKLIKIFLFKSKERKEIERLIDEAKHIIINNISSKELLSIYIGGRILTKDISPTSDIDLYTIVSDDYNLLNDNVINEKLKSLNTKRKCEIKSFFLSDLEGRTKGKTKLFGDWDKWFKIHLKSFRNKDRKLIFGETFDFNKFPIESLSEHEELKEEINGVLKAIDNIKKDNYTDKITSFGTTNFQYLIKQVLHVARMETIISKKIKYESSFHKIEKKLKKERGHIFHEAQNIRKKNLIYNKEDKIRFIKQVNEYINDVKLRLL